MADDVVLNAMSGGDTVAADEIAGKKHQRIKLIKGAEGVNDGDISDANPLPVAGAVSVSALPALPAGDNNIGNIDVVSSALPAGAATSAKQDTEAALLSTIAGMKRLITYAMQRAPGRVVVKHNAMKADTNINANHNQLVIWAGKQGAEIGFEMVGSTLESRFGGTYRQMMQKVAQVEKLAGKKVSYLAPYKPDLAKVGTK